MTARIVDLGIYRRTGKIAPPISAEAVAHARKIEQCFAELEDERFRKAVSVIHGSYQIPCDVEEK